MACLTAAGTGATERPANPELQVVSRFAVSGEPSTATDVRWADGGSVYLERLYDGVSILRLAAGLPPVRQAVPSQAMLGSRHYKTFSRLAASGGFVAFSDRLDFLNWRSLASSPGGIVRFERKPMKYIEDLDLAGDRLLVLGAISYEDPENLLFAVDGAVAFLGSAEQDGQQQLRPVLFDPAGKGAPHLLNCGTLALGAARFLADGSFFILPGFQPGAQLFSPEGRPIRSWNTALLGLDADADCASMTQERRRVLHTDPRRRAEWLNQHRIVDEILPLPSGPGIVVRFAEGGNVHWELDVLEPTRIKTYAIPVEGATPYDRLRGDVRDGKIVLLVVDDSLRAESKQAASQLVVVEVPKG